MGRKIEIGIALTVGELEEIRLEVERISAEMDWRCPDREAAWFHWADDRLLFLIQVISVSSQQKHRLRLIPGGRSA